LDLLAFHRGRQEPPDGTASPAKPLEVFDVYFERWHDGPGIRYVFASNCQMAHIIETLTSHINAWTRPDHREELLQHAPCPPQFRGFRVFALAASLESFD